MRRFMTGTSASQGFIGIISGISGSASTLESLAESLSESSAAAAVSDDPDP